MTPLRYLPINHIMHEDPNLPAELMIGCQGTVTFTTPDEKLPSNICLYVVECSSTSDDVRFREGFLVVSLVGAAEPMPKTKALTWFCAPGTTPYATFEAALEGLRELEQALFGKTIDGEEGLALYRGMLLMQKVINRVSPATPPRLTIVRAKVAGLLDDTPPDGKTTYH